MINHTFMKNMMLLENDIDFVFLSSEECNEVLELEHPEKYIIATATDGDDLICCRGDGNFVSLNLKSFNNLKHLNQPDFEKISPGDFGTAVYFGEDFTASSAFILEHEDVILIVGD